ncbi:MAG: hypothetical protein IPH51_23905 [Rubrivivax sp.]|nr:hypothetical protein [Rubrivivax sp.]
MNTPHRPDDDVPRDARLQAALRHAPDHDAAPPPALSARILEHARQAALPTRAAASQGRGFERWFGWLSTPMAAGALGSLLIAGLVGLMWQGGPPPEALPGQDPIAAPAQEATPTAAAPAIQTEATAPAKPSAALSAPQAPPAPQTAPQPGAGRAARHDALAERQREPAPAAPAPAPAPVVAPAAAPRPETAADAKLGSATGQIQGPGPQRAERSEAAIKGAAAPPAATNAQAAARLAAPAHDVLAPVIAELAADGGAGDAVWRDRLSALRTRVQGEWRPSEPLPPGAGDVVSDALGRPLGRLRVDGPNITWQGNDGRAWQAQLQP